MSTFDIKDIEAVTKVAIDRCNNDVTKYSNNQADELITQALIEANNGKTYLDWRDVRDGKCRGFFTILETVIYRTTMDGLRGDEYFNEMVETHDVAMGDKPEFVSEGSDLFVVSKGSDGNSAVRRQRLTGLPTVTVPTYWHWVKVYDELSRILGNKIDISRLVDLVGKSVRAGMLDDIYTAWTGVTASDVGGTEFVVSGTYDEEDLMDLVDLVEAKSGASAIIYATKKGARKLTSTVQSDAAKDDLYNIGYYGKFFGTPVVAINQRIKPGTNSLLFDDNVITVAASVGKPIKLVLEGDPIINMDNPLNNPDLTQNYLYGQKYGVGFMLSEGAIGKYTITG